MKKIRQEFADTMLEIGRLDKRLVVLIGDISHHILQPFAKAFSDRFYNIGICEQAMVNMAAGLSKVGLIPVIHTITPFIVERAFEQLKLDFGYQKLGVNIVCVGSAFDYSSLGCTHHCYDDFALLKNIEGTNIMYPASCKEFNSLFKQTYNNGMVNYFRLPEQLHGIDYEDSVLFEKGILIKKGTDITVIALGSQLKTVMDSVELLLDNKINPEIIYLSTIKPLDIKLIRKSLQRTKHCLVIEEHSKYGGLFDDILRETIGMDIKFSSINIGDKFIHKYGTYANLCQYLGFTKVDILHKIKGVKK